MPNKASVTRKQIVQAAIINFVINGVIAWLCFGLAGKIPLWGGMQSVFGDGMVFTFVIVLLLNQCDVSQIGAASYVVGKAVYTAVLAGLVTWLAGRFQVVAGEMKR